MEWKIYLRGALIVLLVYSLYLAGLPLQYVILLGIISFGMLFLRGKIYQKIEGVIGAKFPKYHALPGWAKRVVIIIIFLVSYFILKQIIFFALKIGGMDVQQDINDAVSSYAQK